MFDTRRGTLILWRIEKHRLLSKWLWHDSALVEHGRIVLGALERSKHQEHLRNLYANVVCLLVQPPRELSRRSKNVCVGPCADPLRFSARFADFSLRPARNSDNSFFRGAVRKPLQVRNIAGWANLPGALGREA